MNGNILIGILAVGALSIFTMSSWGMEHHMGGYGMMGSWGGMGYGLGIFLVLGLIGLGLIFFANRSFTHEDDRAKTIARERYAKGELTKDEFDEIMKNL